MTDRTVRMLLCVLVGVFTSEPQAARTQRTELQDRLADALRNSISSARLQLACVLAGQGPVSGP